LTRVKRAAGSGATAARNKFNHERFAQKARASAAFSSLARINFPPFLTSFFNETANYTKSPLNADSPSDARASRRRRLDS
jgi:hypothetical protein